MPPDRMKRRHTREKAAIDHLADKMSEPAASIDEPPNHSPTSTGLPVEEQVRKEWDSRKRTSHFEPQIARPNAVRLGLWAPETSSSMRSLNWWPAKPALKARHVIL